MVSRALPMPLSIAFRSTVWVASKMKPATQFNYRSMTTPACLRKKKVEPIVFVGTLREDFKKFARERATEKGLILGLLQDSKGTRTYLNLQDKPIRKVHDTLGFYNTVYPLQVEGQEPMQCIVRSLHINPIRDVELRNIVLLAYKPGNNTRVHIPVQLQNEERCPGIKKGGVINLVMDRITCICNGPTIPTSIALDLSKVEIGHGCVFDLNLAGKTFFILSRHAVLML
jgi:large subunit ribosomal protein L25